MSKNPVYYSHKSNLSALNYKLAISLTESRLVWIKGYFPASVHDINVFGLDKGLASKLPDGKKALGDKGYHGNPDKVGTPNPMDPEVFRNFKCRA
jgi:hypothetical protein